MNRTKIYFGLVLLFIIISCSSEPIIRETEFTSYQVPGCFHNAGLQKSLASDSCFGYSFNDTLKIEFCVKGNCCPEMNRFTTSYKIKSDTIFVSVADTAAQLCYCICNYKIHIELSNFENNKYLFYCNYDNFKYREFVQKEE